MHLRQPLQPAHDPLGTFLEGCKKFLTSKTYRGSSGDSQGSNLQFNDKILI